MEHKELQELGLSQSTIKAVLAAGLDTKTFAAQIKANPAEDQKVKYILDIFPGVSTEAARAQLRKCNGSVEAACEAFMLDSMSVPPPLAPLPSTKPTPKPLPTPFAAPPAAQAPPAAAPAAAAAKPSQVMPLDESAFERRVAAEMAHEAELRRAREAAKTAAKPLPVVRAPPVPAAATATGTAAAAAAAPVPPPPSREYEEEKRKVATLTQHVAQLTAKLASQAEQTTKVSSLEDQLEQMRKQLTEAEAQRSATEQKQQQGCYGTVTLTKPPEGTATSIVATWKVSGFQPSPRDWLALFIHNREWNYSAWEYTKSMAEGSHRFDGLLNGYYDVRYFMGGAASWLCRSEPILIGPRVDVRVALGPAASSHRKIEVTWTVEDSAVASPKDWVGLYTTATRSNKKYITWEKVGTATSVTFDAPRTPGPYEIRYFLGGSGYIYSGKSEVIDIKNIDAVTIETGEDPSKLKLHWVCTSHVPNPRWDYIGLFDKTPSCLKYCYTSTGKVDTETDTGELEFELPRQKMKQGETYEFRLFSAEVKNTHLCSTPFKF